MEEQKKLETTQQTAPAESGARSNHMMVFGIFVSIFAVIGLVFSVFQVGGWAVGLATNQKEIQKFEKYITPVVMLDPASVEDVSKLSDSTKISAAIWDIVLNADKSEYAGDDFTVYVPATDVEAHAKKLFGNDVAYQNASVGDSEYTFEYSAETKMYLVPNQLSFLSYKPQIRNIIHLNDTYTLEVGYLPQNDVWGRNKGADYLEEPYKYVEYTVQKTGANQYRIVSIVQMDQETHQPATSLPPVEADSTQG